MNRGIQLVRLRNKQGVSPPIKIIRRADGGSVPAFDPSQPFDKVASPAFDPSKPFDEVPSSPKTNETPSVSTASDVAKSAGIGLVKGGVGLAGLPGDLAELGARGIDRATQYIGGKLGVDVAPRPDAPPTYGSSDIQKGIEGVTGQFYEPKTTAGEYAQTAGEFLPAMIGGPESLAAKAATRVVGPAVASETAGQLTKGTVAEPYARIAGGVLGGVGATMAANRAAAAAAHTAVPTSDELRVAAQAGYNNPIVTALEIKPAAVATKADDIISDLNRMGFRERNAPNTYAVVEDLKDPIGFSPTTGGTAAKVADFDSVRKELNTYAGERNSIGKPTAEASAAQRAIGHIDDFLDNISPADVIKGDPKQASQILQEARGNWSAASHIDDIDTRLTRAERQAAKAGTGSNIDNAIRQKISAVLDVTGRTRGYTPEEIAQMERVVRGTPTSNLMRVLGKFGVSGGLSLLLHAGAAIPSGGATIPIAVAGTIARKIGEKVTQNNAAKISEMIGNRSPLGQSIASTSPTVARQSILNRTAANTLLAGRSAQDAKFPPLPVFDPNQVRENGQ